MLTNDIQIKWSPGHTGIEGNEAADKLADYGAAAELWDDGPTGEPTVSGIRSEFRKQCREAQDEWWTKQHTRLSKHYKQWALSYTLKEPAELRLPRQTLHHLLALRTTHGDFEWYHKKYHHDDAELRCSCGRSKTPDHLVYCKYAARSFAKWPEKPLTPPWLDKRDAIEYLQLLVSKPELFASFLETTHFFDKICKRH